MKVVDTAMNILQNIKDLLKTEKNGVIECAIDDTVVDCNSSDFVGAIDDTVVDCNSSDFVGAPAPIIAPEDKWFNPPVLTEKGKDYMIQEMEIKQQMLEHRQESENIHQVMYDMATKSGKTTLQLDPLDTWNSGIGA